MSRPRSLLRRCWGFTLIELLVVISIIALLISLLLPSLGEAKATALDLKCLSNMHQIGVGFHQYQSDFKQLPGIQLQSFVYAASWGRDGAAPGLESYWRNYGGMQLYNRYTQEGPGFGGGYNSSKFASTDFNQPGTYGYMGIGFVAMYNGTFRNRDLRIFGCPTVPTEGAPTFPSSSWKVSRYSLFEQAPTSAAASVRVLSTYWYRGGAYCTDPNLPDSDPNWGAGPSLTNNWAPMLSIPKPDAPVLQGKSYLTCYSYGYVSPYFPNDVPPMTAAHRTKLTNLARTDGSAKRWNLANLRAQNGHPIRNIFGWYDGSSWNASQLYDPSSPHNNQLPYWWVRADRGE